MKIHFSDLSGGIKFCLVVLVLSGVVAAVVPKLPPVVVNKSYVGTDASDTYYIAKYDGSEVRVPRAPQIYSPDGPFTISFKDGEMTGYYTIVYGIDGRSTDFNKNFLLYLSSTRGNNESIKKDIIEKVVASSWQNFATNTTAASVKKNGYNCFIGSNGNSTTAFENLKIDLWRFGIGIQSISFVGLPTLTIK